MNAVSYIIYHIVEGIVCVIPNGNIVSLGCSAGSGYLVISRCMIAAADLASPGIVCGRTIPAADGGVIAVSSTGTVAAGCSAATPLGAL